MEPLSPTRYFGQKIIRVFGLVPAGEKPRPPERIGCSFGDRGLVVAIAACQPKLMLHFLIGVDERLVGWAYRCGNNPAIERIETFPASAREILTKINDLMDGFLPYAFYSNGPARDELIAWLTAPARSSDSPAPVTDRCR